MSKVAAQAAFLLDIGRLVVWATEQGYVVTGGELARPVEMQAIYVKTGRSKTMNSRHIVRMAQDLNFFLNGVYLATIKEMEPIGRYWESLSPKNRWGGNFDKDWTKPDNFKDGPHFERAD